MRLAELVIKIVVTLLLVVSAVVVLLSRGSKPPSQAEIDRGVADWAARMLLESEANLTPTDFLIGSRFDEGRWDFRGSVLVAGGRDPVYGVIELTCATAERRPDCWRLARLDRDGRSIEQQAAGNTGNSGATTAAPEPQAGAARTEAARTAPVPAATATEPAAPRPDVEYWTVSGDGINGRAGPGTDFPVVARLNAGVRLEMVGTSGEWGRFLIREPGESEGSEVWVWSALVQRRS